MSLPSVKRGGAASCQPWYPRSGRDRCAGAGVIRKACMMRNEGKALSHRCQPQLGRRGSVRDERTGNTTWAAMGSWQTYQPRERICNRNLLNCWRTATLTQMPHVPYALEAYRAGHSTNARSAQMFTTAYIAISMHSRFILATLLSLVNLRKDS